MHAILTNRLNQTIALTGLHVEIRDDQTDLAVLHDLQGSDSILGFQHLAAGGGQLARQGRARLGVGIHDQNGLRGVRHVALRVKSGWADSALGGPMTRSRSARRLMKGAKRRRSLTSYVRNL